MAGEAEAAPRRGTLDVRGGGFYSAGSCGVEGVVTEETAFSLAELERTAELVHEVVPPTPLYAWPLLAAPYRIH